MDQSNLILGSTFSKFREQPKWVLNLIIWLIVVSVSIWLTVSFSDFTGQLTNNNPGADMKKADAIMGPVSAITSILGSLFTLLFSWLIVLAIARIFKSQVRKRSIFAGTVFALLVSSCIALVVTLIQVIVGLDLVQYSITSLNIFDKGNKVLGAFNLQTLISGYLFTLLLYKTCRLSGKVSIIFGVVFVVLSIGSALIGAIGQ
ncbi:YIP1 family protein [Staphylococcus debuckii]|uniref:YIP1 family protein n=1 Tax=Staphylococcus debuckii TaxID=2044912 RepID=A0ABU9F0L6_9STAP